MANILKYLLITCLLLSCTRTEQSIKYDPFDPHTPTQSELDQWAELSSSQYSENLTGINIKEEKFSGWAKKVFNDTKHKYRYYYYKDGIQIWQIGYFEDGKIDHDFRTQDGESIGIERMWKSNGNLYVEGNYIRPGIKHGKQIRYYPNDVLALEAYFDNGNMLYQVEYSMEGEVTSTTGDKSLIPK